jgi:hypothetical protein
VTDLRDDLAPLLELAGTPIEDLAARRRRRRARRRLTGAAVCGAFVVLLGAGVVAADGDGEGQRTTTDGGETTPTSGATVPLPEPSPTTSPLDVTEGLVVLPATARPGEVVDLFVPGGERRGVTFTLEPWGDGGWSRATFGLTSDGGGPYDRGGSALWVAGPGPYPVDGLGVEGSGPDRVVVPDVAPPGRYRICHHADPVHLCGELQVAGEPVTSPPRPPAEHEPELLTTSRWMLRPGEAFSLRFPTEIPRGVMSTLARWDGAGWTDPIAQLHSSAAAYAEPQVEAPGATFPSVQVDGPGPDPVVLPDDLEPGWYRICAAEVAACDQIRVVDPLPADSGPVPTSSTIAPQSTAPTGPMVAAADHVTAGDVVELWFPTGVHRGVAFTLVGRADGSAVGAAYVLEVGSGPDGLGVPAWAEGTSWAGRLPARSGIGPERIVIPPVAEAGPYRLCAWADDDLCVDVEVAQPPESPPAPAREDDHLLELWHCGILPTTFLGETWAAEPAPFDQTNAPVGATTGTITALDDDEARYVGSDGSVVRFVRLDGAWLLPPCP